MTAKIKTAIVRKAIIYILKKTQKPFICAECIHKYSEYNLLPCICPKMQIPCPAISDKYTSKKNMAKLLLERNAVQKGDFLTTEYDCKIANIKFIQSALERYKRDNEKEENYAKENTND